MKITDFLSDDVFNLPRVQGPKEDYKLFINRIFKEFLEKLESIEYFEDITFDINRIKERQNHLVQQLKSAISNYYAGKPASALSELEKGLNSNLKNFEEILNVREFHSDTDFYKIRIHKLNFPLKPENFFHIPFDLRGKIKTQQIETLFSQLCDQFMIRRNYAKTFQGFKARILSKLTSLTIIQFINKFVFDRNINNIKISII